MATNLPAPGLEWLVPRFRAFLTEAQRPFLLDEIGKGNGRARKVRARWTLPSRVHPQALAHHARLRQGNGRD